MPIAPPRVVAAGEQDWLDVPAEAPALDIPLVTVSVRVGEETDVRALTETDSELLLSAQGLSRIGQVLPMLQDSHLAVITQYRHCGVVVGECTVEVGETGDGDLPPGAAFLKFIDRETREIYAIRGVQETMPILVQFAKDALAPAARAQLALSVQDARKRAGEV